MKKYLLLLSVSLLTACSINPAKQTVVEPVIATRTTYTLVAIPDTLITSCKVDQPPSVKDYLAADWQNKEAMLSVYVKSLLSNLAVCNAKLGNIRKWNQSQKDIYNTKDKE